MLNFVDSALLFGALELVDQAEGLLDAPDPARQTVLLPEIPEPLKAQCLHQGKGEQHNMVGEIPLQSLWGVFSFFQK